MEAELKDTKRNLKKQIPSLIVVVIFALYITLSFIQDSSPRPLSESAPATEFSAERAMKHVKAIAQAPHPTGSDENDQVMAYIQSQMKILGVEPIIQTVSTADLQQGNLLPNYIRATTVSNIIGRLPGTNSTKALMLTAHYDSVPYSRGASDDGVGVATLLETLRVLREGPPLQNDIIFLITDGEELDLDGARAYWDSENSPFRSDIGMVVNFEARGTKGPSLMFQTSRENGWIIDEFAKSVKYPVSTSMMGDVYALMPNDTDMTISNAAGISGINFAFGDGWTNYHSMQDSIENVSLSTLQHHGVNALSAAKQFGQVDLTQTKEADQVYFNVLGSLIHYPKAYVVYMTLGAVILGLYAAFIGFRKKILLGGQLALGFLGILGGIIVSIGATYGLWMAVERLWGYKLHVSNGAMYYHNWFALAFIFLTFGICFVIWGLMKAKVSMLNFWFTGQLLWMIILIAISILLPGGSYLFLWPLVIQLLVMIIALHLRDAEAVVKHPVTLLIIAAGPILLWTIIVRMLFIFMPMATNVYVMGIVVLLLAMLFPLLDVLRDLSMRFWIAITFALSILMLAGSYLVTEMNDRPIDSNFVYVQDVDKQDARWITLTPLNDWTKPYFVQSEDILYYPLIYKVGQSDRLVASSQAPVIPIAKPTVTVLDSHDDSGSRTIHLQVKSNREARRILLTIPEVIVQKVTINGQPFDTDPSTRGFVLSFTGKSPDGIDLEVNYIPKGKTAVIVSDIKDDLTTVQGLDVKPRPANLNPAREFDSTTIASTSIEIN
ncbi:M20/M25/M40 family metallo-hydrolase [Paenibacillus albiflavus]|uniref:M20/M25/M40 family metallo-hydrolase n=1 Tax=Paenibacillus albiflavus TaxID=2545760 RepID=A0A4R4ER74_9BACL|nr:M28 family peptidase [Paenibacillus albiflavus]TCZ80918.1 M20/M25/M40 family metallo-hydrolase [Paenibacillus albiflavus]